MRARLDEMETYIDLNVVIIDTVSLPLLISFSSSSATISFAELLLELAVDLIHSGLRVGWYYPPVTRRILNLQVLMAFYAGSLVDTA